jgi:hypothetical protein
MKELGEFGLIGAGIGGGFLNASELHPQAMRRHGNARDANNEFD